MDPFGYYTEHESDKTSEKMAEVERVAMSKLEPFGDRVNLIKDFSVPAANQVADNSLDFVFIDAIHSYEAVTQDLNAWFSKVRPGGLISGHDVSWGGVREAVEEFLTPRGLAGYYSPSTSDVWFFVKA